MKGEQEELTAQRSEVSLEVHSCRVQAARELVRGGVLGQPEDASLDRPFALQASQEWALAWARPHIVTICKCCSVLSPGRRGRPPHTGTSNDSISLANSVLLLFSHSCPRAWCILL